MYNSDAERRISFLAFVLGLTTCKGKLKFGNMWLASEGKFIHYSRVGLGNPNEHNERSLQHNILASDWYQ